MRKALFAALFLMPAFSCAPAERPLPVDPPSMGAISSATFTGIYNEPVQLVRGRYEGLPFDEGAASRPVLDLVVDLHAEGDLDGDGAPEAAVLLIEASGGTGTFLYLAAVGIRDGGPVNLGTGLVGDRVQVRHLAIDAGEIRLGLVAHASDDPRCCPTRIVEKRWVLEGGCRLSEFFGGVGLREATPRSSGRRTSRGVVRPPPAGANGTCPLADS